MLLLRIVFFAAGIIAGLVAIGFFVARTLLGVGTEAMSNAGLGAVSGVVGGISLLPSVIWALIAAALITISVLLPRKNSSPTTGRGRPLASRNRASSPTPRKFDRL